MTKNSLQEDLLMDGDSTGDCNCIDFKYAARVNCMTFYKVVYPN